MKASEPSALVALSADLAAAVATVGASVAYVDAHPRRDASGLAWDAHHVVTVEHAIDREDAIALLLADGATATATLVGRDPATDIALLHTDTELRPVRRADDAALAVGNLVLAVARDEDGAPGASLGIVSALDGAWRTWRGGDIDRFVRPDVNVYPSFSGGPLVDATGAVIGMNTWGLSRRTALTVPNATLARVVAQLQSGGRVARGYLGIALQAVRLPDTLRAAQSLGQRGAAIVVDVATNGPADRAGVTIGDVLVGIGEHRVEDADDVQRALGSDSVGSDRVLRVLRGGTAHELRVRVEERPYDDP